MLETPRTGEKVKGNVGVLEEYRPASGLWVIWGQLVSKEVQQPPALSCPYPAKGCEEGSGRRVPRPVCVLLPKASFLVRGAGGSALSGRRQGRSPNHLTGSQMCSNWSGCPDPRSPFCLAPHIPLSHLHTAVSLSQAARLPAKKA